MLMDLFFEYSPVAHKRRAHFHEFMADVHERIYGFRQKIVRGEIADGDLIAAHRRVDLRGGVAALLRRIPRHRHRRRDDPGPAVRTTVRTRHRGGGDVERRAGRALQGRPEPGAVPALHRPDRAITWRCCGSMPAPISGWKSSAGVKMWLVPADCGRRRRARPGLGAADRRRPVQPRDISIKGRILHVPCSARRAWRVSRSRNCASKPLAASDYLRLAHDYHTIMIDHIPVMDYAERNAAKRFITLIDTLYDNAVKLMASAERRSGCRCTGRPRASRPTSSSAPPRG